MRQLSTAFLPWFACLGASAQITIGEDDMPDPGDTIRYQTGAVTTFDGADTGPGHVWDYSTLAPITEAADTCVTVGSTPILYQFYFNNPFLYPEHDADQAVKGTGFDFGVLTVSEVFDYFKNNGDGFRNVGFGANVNGLPASIRRLPVDWIHQFPLNFGDADSSFSSFELDVPGVIFYGQDQWRYNEVDGWGTLYLPADTFEVLRVKSTLARIDTIHVEMPFPFGFTLPEPETIEYKWIAQGMDAPVLQINTIAGSPGLVRFYYDLGITTGIEMQNIAGTEVFPNPAEDLVHVRLPGRSHGELLLLDAMGREVRRTHVDGGSLVASVNTAGLAPGPYTLRLLGKESPWSGRLVIDRP